MRGSAEEASLTDLHIMVCGLRDPTALRGDVEYSASVRSQKDQFLRKFSRPKMGLVSDLTSAENPRNPLKIAQSRCRMLIIQVIARTHAGFYCLVVRVCRAVDTSCEDAGWKRRGDPMKLLFF